MAARSVLYATALSRRCLDDAVRNSNVYGGLHTNHATTAGGTCLDVKRENRPAARKAKWKKWSRGESNPRAETVSVQPLRV